ncbi:MAG: transposase, partial [Synergistaceae bacterium]|nr:transposase [Synergistaceae bacterium]
QRKDFHFKTARIICEGYAIVCLEDLNLKWNCPKCNKHHDRDRNAAINIHRVGASTLRGDKIRPDYPYGQSGVCC